MNLINRFLDRMQKIGAATLHSFRRLGRGSVFLLEVISSCASLFVRPLLVVKQLYSVGVQTLIIIVVAGLFVGMVMALQSYYALVDFGAEDSVGVMVALSLLRELGPVVTALLFAGRAGSALTAEIGLMKATEQLSGMEMMAVNPMQRVVAPRFMAGVISMPLLATIFSAVGVIGAYMVAVELLGLDSGAFWSQPQNKVDLHLDLYNGIIKSVVFGVVATWIAVFEGYDCIPTSEGLGQATTRTVVHSSLAILFLDFVLTALMFTK
ncbi:MAG: lipid asymmetry maintenance ABC transporter permease subunit MlaE [Gammaproteobacteria bacterium]|nr:lipid asymmetry maintenance ABC transporter permease subunit MlaE [Gammaproteobacteria bacterium]MBT8132928.1 lipid asymmetry maintenance ABC transporter permease subunit MlaE [Gammaproteobacteria bacterium]NNJ49952.1 lipid asymmetry maintenance ABC transporter permease subunit MlaE [Gammaproteobacteria bacterium]